MEYQEFLKIPAARGALFVISEVKALLDRCKIDEETYFEEWYRINIQIRLWERMTTYFGGELQNRILDITLSKIIDTKSGIFTKDTL